MILVAISASLCSQHLASYLLPAIWHRESSLPQPTWVRKERGPVLRLLLLSPTRRYQESEEVVLLATIHIYEVTKEVEVLLLSSMGRVGE